MYYQRTNSFCDFSQIPRPASLLSIRKFGTGSGCFFLQNLDHKQSLLLVYKERGHFILVLSLPIYYGRIHMPLNKTLMVDISIKWAINKTF